MPTRRKPTRKPRAPRAPDSKVRAYVQQAIARNQETKHLTLSYDTTVQDAARAPLDNSIVAIGQGDTQETRTGNQILVTGLYGRFMVRSADTTNFVRAVLYIPKDPTVTLTSVALDYIDSIDQDKFTVLYDRVFNLNTAGGNQKIFTIARKFNRGARKGIQVQYSGTASTDQSRNNLHLYFVSDSTVVSDPPIYGYMMTYFKDA